MTVEPITKPRPAKPAEAAPHVVRAMSAVTARLAEAGVAKSRNNSQQNYKFRGIDEIMNAMAVIIASERLVIIPRVLARELTERQAKSGMVLFSVVVNVEYTFVSAEDGSRETVGPFIGEAMDTADKATNKAMSAAYKYMAIQTFCIPTEGDNDADATTHDVAPVAAGEGPSPANPPPRQQRRSNVVVNPATGKEKDLENARNQRPEWVRFIDQVQGYTDGRDAEGLKAWFVSEKISEFVAGWVFKDEAHEHVEAALDHIAKMERA